MSNEKASYGYCPICGARGTARERRPNGNDTCTRGHVYPSKDADPAPAAKHVESDPNQHISVTLTDRQWAHVLLAVEDAAVRQNRIVVEGEKHSISMDGASASVQRFNELVESMNNQVLFGAEPKYTDPIYPEYEGINGFINECLDYAKVTDVYDSESSAHEGLVLSILKTVEDDE